jgi:alpha-glucosidase
VQLYTADRPEVHDVIAGMRAVLDEYPERVLIGEIYLPIEKLVTYYGTDLNGAHLPFNFQLLDTVWNATKIAALIREYEELLPEGGWPNWVLGNHDRPRIAARVGEGQARIAAMLLLTLRGTPTIYYGDEIGLSRVDIPPGAAQDPWEKNEPGHGRDPSRTPMQWDASEYGGFTDAPRPWLPLSQDWRTRNVARMSEDRASMLNLYRALIALRRRSRALSVGDLRVVYAEDHMLVYERCEGDERVVVALNFGKQPVALPETIRGRVLLSTLMDGIAQTGMLRGNEGIVLQA